MGKGTVMLGMVIGGVVGGSIPTLWGANPFGLASIIGGAIGGLIGIWLAFRWINF